MDQEEEGGAEVLSHFRPWVHPCLRPASQDAPLHQPFEAPYFLAQDSCFAVLSFATRHVLPNIRQLEAYEAAASAPACVVLMSLNVLREAASLLLAALSAQG